MTTLEMTDVIDIDQLIDLRSQGVKLTPQVVKSHTLSPTPNVVDDLQTSRHSTTSSTATSGSKIKPASFRTLFRFATNKDIATFAVGVFFCIISSATMPAINIVFGDVVDAIAEPINVEELVNTSVRAMAILGLYGFVTFFFSFLFCGYAAANIANAWRMQYLEKLLVQDMTFFDTSEPGSLTLMLSDSAMAIQGGLR
jgi:ABC transporter transmembrane region